jgi:hypothetical protein
MNIMQIGTCQTLEEYSLFRSQGIATSALRNKTQHSRVEGRESERQISELSKRGLFFHRLIGSPFLKGRIFTGIRMVYRICLSVITGSTVPSLLNKVCNSIYVKKKKLEMRLAREESSREFLRKETDREKMLVEEEEKKLLATSSKKIDECGDMYSSLSDLLTLPL